MIKLSQIQKITMAAVMIVLTIIFTRLLSIQNIPGIMFVRLSLGPAVVILASLVLGPFYGGLVGGAADILGIVMFPNSYAINPVLTVVYTLSGVLPFFIFKLFSLIKKEKASFIAIISMFATLFIGLAIFFILKSDIVLYSKTYTFTPTIKAIIMSALLLLSSGLVVAIYFINRSFKNKETGINVYTLALTIMTSEFLVKTIINSFVKAYMFEVDYLYMFISEVLVFFIYVPLYTFFVTYLILLLKKIIPARK